MTVCNAMKFNPVAQFIMFQMCSTRYSQTIKPKLAVLVTKVTSVKAMKKHKHFSNKAQMTITDH